MNNKLEAKTIVKGGYILDFNNIDINLFTPEIMGYGLSNINRWNGHATLGCRFEHINPKRIIKSKHNLFVNDLHHSFLVYFITQDLWPDDENLHLQALLHDAGEVYYGDIIGPLKKQIKEQIRPIEHSIESAIAKRYGLEFPWDSRIKQADLIAQDIEGYLCFDISVGGVNVRDVNYKTTKNDEILFWDSYKMTADDFIQIVSKKDRLRNE